jgi:DNA-binding transcriptional MerR regulator
MGLQVDMKASTSTWSIGETAARFGVDTHVLRHWEDVGLLQPARDSAGYRTYSEADAVRIGLVLCLKVAGMSLEQVRTVIDGDTPGRHDLITSHVDELDRRIAAMVRARSMAAHALECDEHDVAMCPRFQDHLQEVLAGAAARFEASAPPGHVLSAGDPLRVGPAARKDVDLDLDAWRETPVG